MPTLPQRLRSMARTTGLDGVAELLVEAAEAMEQLGKPAAAVISRQRLENESNEEVPRIVAIDKSMPAGTLLYKMQPPASQSREPLSDIDCLEALMGTVLGGAMYTVAARIAVVRAIEAAHGIKG